MGFKYNLIDTIQSIENKDWNHAKSIWIFKVLNLKPNCACLCEDSECEDILKKQISTYGSEYEFFLEPCNRFQTYIINLSCSPCCAFNNNQKNSVSLSFIKKNSLVSLEYTCHANCNSCKNKILLDINFLFDPPWIFIQTNLKMPIYVNELTKSLVFGNKSYQFLSATIYSKKHFRAIFSLNNSFYLFDDLSKTISQKIPKIKVVTSFYFLIS